MAAIDVKPSLLNKLSRKRPFRKNFAKEQDSIIVSFGKGDTSVIKLTRGKTTQNKYGALKHDDVIGRKFGSKITMSRGFCYILALDPVNWTTSLPHRTQIIYTPDASLIIGRLDLIPGRRVMEAGTGSGALTHALAQAVWPSGRVITFDFHEERVERARIEFKEHDLDELVTVQQRDIVGCGFPPTGASLNPSGVHAVMVDLPEPWAVISTLDKCFTYLGGRVCVFSPCIEQVMRTCESLREANFTDIEILECVQRTYDLVHTVLNVPNLGQKDASALMDGSYVFKTHRGIQTGAMNDDGKIEQPTCEKHLFPPPSRYVTPQPPLKTGQGNPGRHQDGSWEAYPKPKGTGHTGYLVFASLVPTIQASDFTTISDVPASGDVAAPLVDTHPLMNE